MTKPSHRFDSWGRISNPQHVAISQSDLGDLQGGQGFLPFGNGRSYGDSCHSDYGRLLDMRSDAKIHSFDLETGILIADSGVLLRDILTLTIPHGYFLEVTPGTSYVTLGGAIANDVHGKNHHLRGTFGHSVKSFSLLRSDLDEIECSRDHHAEYFEATIGGMGLTGVIGAVTLRLMKVTSANIHQKSIRFDHIDQYFDQIDEIDKTHEYSVAWIDQLSSGKHLGRGVLMAGDHAQATQQGAEDVTLPKPATLSVPFTPPINLLNNVSLKAFNFAYFHKSKPGVSQQTVSWQSFFYPLDAVRHWNRLYGPKGLFQHQSVYPTEVGRETTIKLLECAKAHGAASFLTVLKRFGVSQSDGLLSFPRGGFTLTLDFANSGASTLKLLRALDEITVQAGGAVNPYKDQRMAPDIFEASFPKWHALEAMRDPRIMSRFWQRTAMQLSLYTKNSPHDEEHPANEQIAGLRAVS